MVLHRRLNYGFNGYEVPPIPRAARSIRKGSLHRNNVGDNQMCAFDLLATVAGEILLEGRNSAAASSNGICENENILDAVKEELRDDNDKFLNAKDLNQGSPENGVVVDEHKPQVQNHIDKEIINPLGGFSSRPSAIAASGWMDKTDFNGNKALDDKNSQSVNVLKKVEGCSFGDINSRVPKQEDQVSDHIPSQLVTVSEGSFGGGLGHCSSEGPKLINQEPPALVNSDSSIKLYLHRDHYSCGSPFLSRDNVKVVSRDDDEKSCQCAQRSTVMKTSRSCPLSRHRRIRKLLACRYWRRPQKVKNEDPSDTAGEMHSVNQYRRHGFKRQRSQRIYPPKKKLFYSSPSTSDGVTGYESHYMCSEKDTDKPTSAFGALGHGGMLSVVAGQSTSFQSRESHVKVKIKSFRVPELFIELPETATVGSLKKTVMEAVTTLLGGELHVGVVLKGRKIKDDSKTLVQTGISRVNKAAGLCFTLEPNRSQVYSSMGSEDMPLIEMPQPASRPAPAASIAHQSIHASADTPAKDWADFIKSDHDSELVSAEISMDNGTVDSKALVTVPEANAEALEVVPPPKKSKRYEMAQRRIRCPFSIGEVEALVGAVENLGTGRWRDVKLLAFDNAEHRTYVDLKDKWKTLVHTARLSPQQRRGEPVPQELLDRVLAAHDRWSQPQAKQQPNLQPEATLLLGKCSKAAAFLVDERVCC